MDDPLVALGLTFIAGISTTIGAFLGIINKKPKRVFTSFIMAFSAGVMVYLSFVELFEESTLVIGTPIALIFLISGIGLALAIDLLVPEQENVHEHYLSAYNGNGKKKSRNGMKKFENGENKVDNQSLKVKIEQNGTSMHYDEKPEFDKEGYCKTLSCEENQKLMKIGLISLLGIFIHNFPEGLATFSAGLINVSLGVQIMIAIMLHNIPEGMSIAVPIYIGTKSRKKALGYATLSGLAEPLGAIVAWIILAPILTTEILMGLYAFVAGIMIYISIDVLIPTANTMERKHVSVMGFTLGLILIAISLIFL